MSSVAMSQLIIHKSRHNSGKKFLFSTYSPLAAIGHQIISDVGDLYNKGQWSWLKNVRSYSLKKTRCRELASQSSNLGCGTAAQQDGSVDAKWDECLLIAISFLSCRKIVRPKWIITRLPFSLACLELNVSSFPWFFLFFEAAPPSVCQLRPW